MLATGLSFEVVAGFTKTQFYAIKKAAYRHWELLAMVNGFRSLTGGATTGSTASADNTEAFEKRVTTMKKQTGKDSLDLWEVV